MSSLDLGTRNTSWIQQDNVLETPKNRVSLGTQVNSYVHRQQYRQPQMTPLFGYHREKRTLKQFETNALTRQSK